MPYVLTTMIRKQIKYSQNPRKKTEENKFWVISKEFNKRWLQSCEQDVEKGKVTLPLA